MWRSRPLPRAERSGMERASDRRRPGAAPRGREALGRRDGTNAAPRSSPRGPGDEEDGGGGGDPRGRTGPGAAGGPAGGAGGLPGAGRGAGRRAGRPAGPPGRGGGAGAGPGGPGPPAGGGAAGPGGPAGRPPGQRGDPRGGRGASTRGPAPCLGLPHPHPPPPPRARSRRAPRGEAPGGGSGEGRPSRPQARLSAAEAALARSLEEAAGLRAERAAQGERLHGLEMERRRLHDQVQDLKGNVRVFCRVRPGPAGEPGPLTFPAGPGPGPTRLTLTRPGPPAARHDFRFDRVFPPGSGQEEVFGEVAPLVQSALDGRPVCIFAYGQTGSGKTYTVEGGPEGEAGAEGLIPRAVRHLLGAAGGLRARGWRYAFAAAFLEVYNDAVRDLLAEGPAGPCGVRRAGPAGDELAVTDARRVPVDSLEEVEELLRRARARRAVARTSRNARSSRSHGLFQLHIAGDHPARGIRTRATLSLVDLAGSERLRDGDGGDGERLRETQAINSSLSALGLVITALANKEPHVPYRNSKLTYLLQSCLSGSAKTLMFVNISPLEENLSESLNSLRFAAKVNQCVIGRAQTNRK
uniref:Kinesin-like protein n=1 Tax=Ornithorhynchus anatinus TaxID=9258 RepID=A0A6I8NQ33_ORNAN